MKNWQILKSPVISEKSMAQVAHNLYTFQVEKSSTKGEIKNEIEKQFKVTVLRVRTINYKQETKLSARTRKPIVKSGYKKAIVLLPADQKIDLFETQSDKKSIKTKKQTKK